MPKRKRPSADRDVAPGDDFQVGPGTVVAVAYEVYDEEDALVDSSGEAPISVVFGCGQLLAPLEDALAGLGPGATRSVVLPPGEAYGEWHREAVLSIDPSEFPAGTAPGDQFEAENVDGAVLVFKVLDVTPDAVVLDTNHPLAGQQVRFSLEVRAVRPATEEELAVAERALFDEGCAGPELVPPGRLLRRGERR